MKVFFYAGLISLGIRQKVIIRNTQTPVEREAEYKQNTPVQCRALIQGE